ncbi:hypothetical protein SOCE26_028390 [Sorangium cellulosum]|uniref:Secreted protein n=1 Tax=Sorangium cellulosum TaxID=56 RepID=A0A2L0EQ44_SORCE|nr:hypothetical protein [Sorangium cellulosum]AUX41427.1 hypothetical protein SOCE26_028390 [Sorangium cellulosum]
MRTSRLPLAALLTSLAACTVNGPREPAPEPAPTATAPTTAAPTAPTAPPTSSAPPAQASGDEALLGSWTSAACAPRKYERVLSFGKDGSFTAEDRVSPCPPKVACVWSGIVHHKGTFKRSGGTIALSVAEASQGRGAQPFPATLAVDPRTGVPAETGEDGKLCPYQR